MQDEASAAPVGAAGRRFLGGEAMVRQTATSKRCAVVRKTLRPVGARPFLRYTGFSLRSGPATGHHRGASGRKKDARAGHGLVPSSRTGREGPTQPQRSGRTR